MSPSPLVVGNEPAEPLAPPSLALAAVAAAAPVSLVVVLVVDWPEPPESPHPTSTSARSDAMPTRTIRPTIQSTTGRARIRPDQSTCGTTTLQKTSTQYISA